MRKKEREISREEAEKILEKGEYGILSTIGEIYPYGVPLSYAYEDGTIYYHGTVEESMKADNIKKNPKVCFTVVGDTEVIPKKFTTKYESAIAFGTVKLAVENKRKGLQLLVEKYSSDFMEKGMKYINSDFEKVAIYEIMVEELTGKARR